MQSVNGKFSRITREDIRQVANTYSLLGVCNAIVAESQAAIARWPEFAEQAGLPHAVRDQIALTHQEMAAYLRG